MSGEVTLQVARMNYARECSLGKKSGCARNTCVRCGRVETLRDFSFLLRCSKPLADMEYGVECHTQFINQAEQSFDMRCYLSGESRHASNLLPDHKFDFPKNQHWPERRGTSPAVTQRSELEEEDDPVFDNSLFTNVTAQLGKVAHLQCTVLNIKQSNPVSERERDIYLPDSNLFLLASESVEG